MGNTLWTRDVDLDLISGPEIDGLLRDHPVAALGRHHGARAASRLHQEARSGT
jgi:hypothetical protein